MLCYDCIFYHTEVVTITHFTTGEWRKREYQEIQRRCYNPARIRKVNKSCQLKGYLLIEDQKTLCPYFTSKDTMFISMNSINNISEVKFNETSKNSQMYDMSIHLDKKKGEPESLSEMSFIQLENRKQEGIRTMSVKDYMDEKGGQFAKFLKAENCIKLPISLNLLKTDMQELPNSGKTLIARFNLDQQARKQLKADYIKGIDDIGVKDIAFPLNMTNVKKMAKLFGDAYGNWKGKVTLYVVLVTNPKDKKEVKSLRVQTPEDEE